MQQKCICGCDRVSVGYNPAEGSSQHSPISLDFSGHFAMGEKRVKEKKARGGRKEKNTPPRRNKLLVTSLVLLVAYHIYLIGCQIL